VGYACVNAFLCHTIIKYQWNYVCVHLLFCDNVQCSQPRSKRYTMRIFCRITLWRYNMHTYIMAVMLLSSFYRATGLPAPTVADASPWSEYRWKLYCSSSGVRRIQKFKFRAHIRNRKRFTYLVNIIAYCRVGREHEAMVVRKAQ